MVKRPNRLPVRSIARLSPLVMLFFAAVSFLRHPQDLVLPVTREPDATVTLFPHWHRHSHRTLFDFGYLPFSRSTISRPNVIPVRSLKLLISQLPFLLLKGALPITICGSRQCATLEALREKRTPSETSEGADIGSIVDVTAIPASLVRSPS